MAIYYFSSSFPPSPPPRSFEHNGRAWGGGVKEDAEISVFENLPLLVISHVFSSQIFHRAFFRFPFPCLPLINISTFR